MTERHPVTIKPPSQLVLVFCPVCGRDDRITSLRQNLAHFSPAGRKCPGKPIKLTYSKNP